MTFKKSKSTARFVSLGAKAQSFVTVISPQALSLKVCHKLRRVSYWELRLLEEGFISPLLDIYKNRGLHLDVWCWTLLNGSERNGHFQVEIQLILLWMWKTVGWHLHSTHNFFGHLNPKLGDLTEVPDLLCLCRSPFASKWDNVGLELSFPECKHSMGCLLLGYRYFFLSTILQSTLPVLLALPFITLLKLQHKPDMYRNATRYHVMLTGYTTGSAWLLSLHHRSHQNHYMFCLQKQVQTDSGSSDVLQVGLKQAWSCIKMWNH